MIYEHAELRVHPGAGPHLEADFAAARHLLLESSGCRSAELLRGVDQPGTYLLRVGWDRLEDHTEVFPGTPQAQAFAEAVAPHCVAEPRVVHYLSQGGPENGSPAAKSHTVNSVAHRRAHPQVLSKNVLGGQRGPDCREWSVG